MVWDRDEEQELENMQAAAAIDAVAATVTSDAPQMNATESSTTVGMAVQREYQIVTEAQRRLAKAQLYQALLNQSVFGQSSVQAEIVEEVSNELRTFALERLEIMLGMRSPKDAPVNAAVSLTAEEVGQVRDLLRQAVAGNVPVLGTEESTALRLLLAKITGRAPTLPPKLAPVVQPVQVQATTPINTVQLQSTTPVRTPAPQAAPRPGPGRPRGRPSNNPKKAPMPTMEMMNAHVSAQAASASSSPASPAAGILSVAIQTAVNERNKE